MKLVLVSPERLERSVKVSLAGFVVLCPIHLDDGDIDVVYLHHKDWSV